VEVCLYLLRFDCCIGTRWTLWPSTLSRDYLPSSSLPTPSAPVASVSGIPSSSGASPPPPPKEGLPHPAIQQAIQPRHHQFYGWWRTMDLHDGLPKWEGYAGASERVGE
jgi:hypothetical protein